MHVFAIIALVFVFVVSLACASTYESSTKTPAEQADVLFGAYCLLTLLAAALALCLLLSS